VRPETVVAAAARLAWLAGSRRRRRVERLVRDRGLSVLARRSRYPQTMGFELTLAVPADPDTVAVLRVDPDTDPAAALDEAVREAHAAGDDLRAMRAALGNVVGLYLSTPWVAADFTRSTVATLVDGLARWADRRPVSVYVVAPGAVPALDPAVPALFALNSRERAIALRAAPSHSVVLRADGPVVYRGTTRVEPPG
jgi:transposase InsO family protein